MIERARTITAPEPGFFRMRMVRGGPYVAARIYRPCRIDPLHGDFLDRWFALEAEIDGEPCTVDRVWLYGEPISAGEFEFLMASRRYSHRNRPNAPIARPREAIDFLRVPLPF